MDVFAEFTARTAAALRGLYPDLPEELLTRFVVEPPRDPAHGDLSTNAAMIVARPLGRNPREVAAAIAAKFEGDKDVASTDVAGPGFINFRLNAPIWFDVLASIRDEGSDYGRADIGQGEPVNIEYVSANPTGPMHVGHTRGAVFGDALASLLQFAGFAVTREYYINDAGSQVDTLARSAFLRYREALGETIEIPRGFYPGDYLVPVGKALADEFAGALPMDPTWLAGSAFVTFIHAVFIAAFTISMTRERHELQQRRFALLDPLTGLFNRRAFIDQLGYSQHHRSEDHQLFAMLMLDLDHFKLINDQFGHDAGDRMLQHFADIARGAIPPGDHLFRMGGEEFCAVLRNMTVQQARGVAEKLRLNYAESPITVDGRAIFGTVSIGVAAQTAPAHDLSPLLAAADAALYTAKARGRNQTALAGPQLAEVTTFRAAIA